jgi:hypothetical protein
MTPWRPIPLPLPNRAAALSVNGSSDFEGEPQKGGDYGFAAMPRMRRTSQHFIHPLP